MADQLHYTVHPDGRMWTGRTYRHHSSATRRARACRAGQEVTVQEWDDDEQPRRQWHVHGRREVTGG